MPVTMTGWACCITRISSHWRRTRKWWWELKVKLGDIVIIIILNCYEARVPWKAGSRRNDRKKEREVFILWNFQNYFMMPLGADQMIRGKEGGMVFCPVQTFLLLLTRNQLFFPSGKGTSKSPPYNPIFLPVLWIDFLFFTICWINYPFITFSWTFFF